MNLIEKYVLKCSRIVKSRFAAFNVVIIIVLINVVTISLILTLGYQRPTDFEQKTGIVASLDQYDEKEYDNIFGNSKGSYFNVRLEDGSFFEATGMCYDNIDRALFEDLRTSEEITITYFEKSGESRSICAIEYSGNTYLSLDDVLADYEENERTVHIVGPTIIGVSLFIGAILIFINYKRNYSVSHTTQ